MKTLLKILQVSLILTLTSGLLTPVAVANNLTQPRMSQLLVQMVAVGEESGRLDQMLLRVADAYDRETTTATKLMTSLLAPVMILFVAGIVGFIVLSMMLPIFRLSSVLG